MLVKVWNDNVVEHREKFKGDLLIIPAGHYVEMQYEEACEFKGQFTAPAPKDISEAEAVKYYKKIRVEMPKVFESKADDALICHADGTKAQSQAELAAKIVEFANLRVKVEDAERAVKAKSSERDAEIEALKTQVADLHRMLSAQTQKRGPGRPKKAEAG